MNKPVVNYDRTHDILYFVIREGDEHHFVETAEGIVVEFDESNQPIGIEISDASHVLFQAMERSDLALTYA
jgi:uncharacterized protein YuzE